MATTHERIGDALVFHVGEGEWFNHLGNYRWDMGEDAEERPPSPWHLELQTTIDQQEPMPRCVVVDASTVDRLVSLDLGFLVKLSMVLSETNTKLAVAAQRNTREAARYANLTRYFDLCDSVEDALAR